MNRTIVAGMAAAIVLATGSASFADAFTTVVGKVLMQDERIIKLDPAHQKEMIACVNQVLASVPPPIKREVGQARTPDEMQDRFGKMVLANQAKFEKAINTSCGHIAVGN